MPSRRQFLTLASAAFAPLALWPWRIRSAQASVRGPALASPSAVAELCLSSFKNLESAAALGRRYLQLAPDEADAARLAANLAAVLAQSAKPSGRRPRRRGWSNADLSNAIRRDFERDNIVVVDGWILAHTEARTCALAQILLHRRESFEASAGHAMHMVATSKRRRDDGSAAG